MVAAIMSDCVMQIEMTKLSWRFMNCEMRKVPLWQTIVVLKTYH